MADMKLQDKKLHTTRDYITVQCAVSFWKRSQVRTAS